jgi:hypothetical protein
MLFNLVAECKTVVLRSWLDDSWQQIKLDCYVNSTESWGSSNMLIIDKGIVKPISCYRPISLFQTGVLFSGFRKKVYIMYSNLLSDI